MVVVIDIMTIMIHFALLVYPVAEAIIKKDDAAANKP